MLVVIVGHKLCDRVPQRRLSEEDDPIQAFFLYGADKSLRERIQVTRSRRQSDDMDAPASRCPGILPPTIQLHPMNMAIYDVDMAISVTKFKIPALT